MKPNEGARVLTNIFPDITWNEDFHNKKYWMFVTQARYALNTQAKHSCEHESGYEVCTWGNAAQTPFSTNAKRTQLFNHKKGLRSISNLTKKKCE